MLKKKKQTFRGMTLIEIVVSLAVLTILECAIIYIFSNSLATSKYSRSRVTAVALANERMEELRNLPYDSLGTENGSYPAGTLKDDYQISRGSQTYNIHTVIRYIDDPFDGNFTGTIPGKPIDLFPYDYKKIEVSVSLVGSTNIITQITSNVSAKAAETSSNTGIIYLCVINAASQPVNGASIKIQNDHVSPVVNYATNVGIDGCIMIPKLPPDEDNHYHLEATKAGYSTDKTYPKTVPKPNPVLPDVNVTVQEVTPQTLIIDRLSSMTIAVEKISGEAVVGANVNIEGTKKIYLPNEVKYFNSFVTDGEGKINLTGIEFDDYNFIVSGWTIVAISPYQPVNLQPNTNLSIYITVDNDPAQPIINKCDPNTGTSGEEAIVKIDGDHFTDPVTIKLEKAGEPDIVSTEVNYIDQTAFEAKLNLSAAALGYWDIIITNSDGKNIRQKNGFNIISG